MKGEVEALRRDPTALAGLGLREIANAYADLIGRMDEPPIIMGHSMGGLIVQLLLNRGLGAAGVAIDSATPKGIYRLPWSVIKASGAVLSNPLNYWRTVALAFDQFRYAFAHVMSESDARAAYDNYAVPGPGRPIFEVAMGNFNPWAPNRVDWNASKRAPLLLIAGSEDRLVPPALTLTNFKLYRSKQTLTAYKEFDRRSHLIAAQPGWEEVAEYALTWTETAIARDQEQADAAPRRSSKTVLPPSTG